LLTGLEGSLGGVLDQFH